MTQQRLIAAVLLAFLAWRNGYLDKLDLGGFVPKPTPKVEVSEPSDSALRNAVTPVRDKLKGHPEQANLLAQLYRDMASVLKRTQPKSSLAVQMLNQRAGQIAFEGSGLEKVPGFSEAAASAYSGYVGSDASKAAAFFEAMSWACSTAN